MCPAEEGRLCYRKGFFPLFQDYVEIGFLCERLFPFLGIRFISVNDHYDSRVVQNQMIGMDLAFKALVNDLYSKDLSGKVISSLHSKKEQEDLQLQELFRLDIVRKQMIRIK